VKKCIAELVGTFILVFCGTGAMIIDEQTAGAVTHIGVALTWGLVVMALIYSIGKISGPYKPGREYCFYHSRAF
jgi:aquaporin NIP